MVRGKTVDFVSKTHLLPQTRVGWIVFLVFLISIVAMSPPALDWANRIEPVMGNLSFVFWWATLWWLVLVADMILYFRFGGE